MYFLETSVNFFLYMASWTCRPVNVKITQHSYRANTTDPSHAYVIHTCFNACFDLIVYIQINIKQDPETEYIYTSFQVSPLHFVYLLTSIPTGAHIHVFVYMWLCEVLAIHMFPTKIRQAFGQPILSRWHTQSPWPVLNQHAIQVLAVWNFYPRRKRISVSIITHE